MSFWKRLFGIKSPAAEKTTEITLPPQAMPELPTVISLIPDKLSVRVFYHEVTTNQGKIHCLAYLTEGLKSVGQRELLLTLKNNQQNPKNPNPKSPIGNC